MGQHMAQGAGVDAVAKARVAAPAGPSQANQVLAMAVGFLRDWLGTMRGPHRCTVAGCPILMFFNRRLVMKQLIMGAAISVFAATAFAHGCPGEMRAIDAKMPTAKLSAADMSKAKALREEGEKLHKEGKHTESMKALAEAKKLLGV